MIAEYHIVGRGQLSQTGKNLLDAMTVRVGVQVRHRIHGKCHVGAMIVGAARWRRNRGHRSPCRPGDPAAAGQAFIGHRADGASLG
jgi:hypothetical protein